MFVFTLIQGTNGPQRNNLVKANLFSASRQKQKHFHLFTICLHLFFIRQKSNGISRWSATGLNSETNHVLFIHTVTDYNISMQDNTLPFFLTTLFLNEWDFHIQKQLCILTRPCRPDIKCCLLMINNDPFNDKKNMQFYSSSMRQSAVSKHILIKSHFSSPEQVSCCSVCCHRRTFISSP